MRFAAEHRRAFGAAPDIDRGLRSTLRDLHHPGDGSRPVRPVINPLLEPVEPVARFSGQHAILWGPGLWGPSLWGPNDPGLPLLSTRGWTDGKICRFRYLCGSSGAGAYGEASDSTRVHSGRWWNIRIPNSNQESRNEVECPCWECETHEASKARLLWTCKERRRCLGSFWDVRRCSEYLWWYPQGWEYLPSMYYKSCQDLAIWGLFRLADLCTRHSSGSSDWLGMSKFE